MNANSLVLMKLLDAQARKKERGGGRRVRESPFLQTGLTFTHTLDPCLLATVMC